MLAEHSRVHHDRANPNRSKFQQKLSAAPHRYICENSYAMKFLARKHHARNIKLGV